MREVKPHWLSPSAKTRTPSVVVSFDTETTESEQGDHSIQVLRCWDAVVRVRHATVGHAKGKTYKMGERPAQLAVVVEEAALIAKECWVVAHNVSFDLAVTSLPFVMVSRGWTLDSLHLGDESSWWILAKDGHKVIITDSWSWVRCSLADLAADIRRRKVRLPDAADDLTTWHHRCRVDADILDEAMSTMMDWWDGQELGVFGITGAACGWRSLRATIQPKRILVGPDGDRTAFERLAVYGGCKEVYGVGEFHETWIADYDFVSAYTTAAAAHPLPAMPAKKWTSVERLLDANPPPQRDYIAEVEITTHRPCAPVRLNDEVWWPVGTFTTVLSGPEVRYAMTIADSVKAIRYESYKTGFALADWAAWCLKIQSASPDEVPPIMARVAKNWGRLAIGRFAARTSRVVSERASTHAGWHLETGHDLDTGARIEWLSMGGVERTIVKDLDGNDVFPAVLAFIEGHVRVALRQMMDSRDPRDLLQCNTDGWWEMNAVRASKHQLANIPWPFKVSRKALERRLTVKGPNHVLTPHERRYAGIPSEAVGLENETMHWRDWPSLRWQLEHSEAGEYRRPDREAILAEHYVRRWVLESGETVPVTMTLDDHQTPLIAPWCRSWGQLDTDVLAPYQVPTLVKINETDRELGEGPGEALPLQPGRGFRHIPRGGKRRDLPRTNLTPPPKYATADDPDTPRPFLLT